MGKCHYYTVREAKGRVFSRSNIENKRLTVFKHLLPILGVLKLDHITTELWEKLNLLTLNNKTKL